MDKTQIQELKKKIDKAKVVSFDMYDTLVFRKTRQPQDIFALVECGIGISGFADLRERAQRRAARSIRQKYGYPHPNMHEIYTFLSRGSQKMLQAEKIERKLEECLAVRNPAMHRALRYAREQNKRVVVTSDMYMERFQLEKILKKCSITEWDAVYVSSEFRKTKYDGTIYDFIIEKESAAPCEILHIGDDLHADVYMAEKKGIAAYWYRNKEIDLAESLYKSSHPRGAGLFGERMGIWDSQKFHGSIYGDANGLKEGMDIWDGRKSYGSIHGDADGLKEEMTIWDREETYSSLHDNANEIKEEMKEETAFWYNLGYQIGGPLYMGLCLWLKKKLGHQKLFCLSRDGYNLTRLLPQFGISDVEYIYASRRALLLPHITRLGQSELELLPPYSCGQSVGEILSYIGLDEIPEAEIRKAGFDGACAVIRGKSDIKRLKQLYKRNEKLILESCRQERAGLKKYFASKELFRKELYQQLLFQKEVCFFDSGWNGTSQYLLRKIYQALQTKGSIRFYYAGIKSNADSRQRLKGCRFQSYFAGTMDRRTMNQLLASSAVLELFFSEDAPAVERYGISGIQFDAYQKREYIRCVNQGIEDYIRQNKVLRTVLSAEALERFGTHNLVKLVLDPSAGEAEYIGNIENADRLSEADGMKKYVARITKEALIANPLLDIYWAKGVYRHPRNAWYVKVFVWFRQMGAWVYRAGRRMCRRN